MSYKTSGVEFCFRDFIENFSENFLFFSRAVLSGDDFEWDFWHLGDSTAES